MDCNEIRHNMTVTKGIRQLIFGDLRVADVLRRYESGDSELCHRLVEIPGSPGEYLELDRGLRERWEPLLGEAVPEEWAPPFYVTETEKPFHQLCEFYRILIFCECRLVVMATDRWVNELEMMLLKYELIELRDELIELLKEINGRMGESEPKEQHPLELYLHRLLRAHLIMTIDELQLRHYSIFESRAVSERELWLKHLEQPVPERKLWHRTVHCTHFELERAVRPPNALSVIEDLLHQVQEEVAGVDDQQIPGVLIKSLQLLENAWLIGFLQEKGDSITLLTDSSAVKERISRIEERLLRTDIENSEAQSDLQLLLEKADTIREVLSSNRKQHPSEALNLLYTVVTIFDPSPGVGGVVDGAENVVQERSDQNGSGTVLDDYVRVDTVKDKINVTDKVLKKYLNESKTTVINFSNKNRWIHRDDLQSMLDHFKTQL